MVCDYKPICTNLEKAASANIFFVGHRFEDDVSAKTLLDGCSFEFSQQYKDCVVGKVVSGKFESVIQFLKDNFISGYIIWFANDVDFSISDFGKFFLQNKKTCLLTKIYKANRVAESYVIDVPEELREKIMGMVFTESGENIFTLIQK